MTVFTVQDLDFLEQQLQSPRDIANLRIKLLEEDGKGFAVGFVPLLREAVNSWFEFIAREYVIEKNENGLGFEEKKQDDTNASVTLSRSATSLGIQDAVETKILARVLAQHVLFSQQDPVLAREVGLEGSHRILQKLISFDVNQSWSCQVSEEDCDAVMDLQDLACEVASTSPSFPLKVSPFTQNDLKERLPLRIAFTREHQILIQQVPVRQTAQKDVGFVLWPSAVALSQWLIQNTHILMDCQSILELGAGCGLVGLLAAQLSRGLDQQHGQSSSCITILTDFNPVVLENLKLNANLNNVPAISKKLDFYQQTGDRDYWVSGDDGDEDPQSQVDLILAADMICQPSDAVAAANTIHDALSPNGRAIVVCANGTHRFGVDTFEQECRRVGLQIETSQVEATAETNMNMTAGYVEGMELTMFHIQQSSGR